MNIWIVNHYAIPPSMGGLVRHYYFSKHLRQKGYKVKIFTSSKIHNKDINMIKDRSLYKECIMDGVEYTFVRSRNYKGNGLDRILNMIDFPFKMWKSMKKFYKWEKPDVIYASSPDLFVAFFGLLFGKKHKIPVVVEIRDLWPESIVEYKGMSKINPIIVALYWLERWIYKEADQLVFTMAGGLEYLRDKKWDRIVNLAKVNYVNNGVDTKEFQQDIKEFVYHDYDLDRTDMFNVVYVGSIRQANNVGALVEVAEILENKEKNKIQFLIYGDGTDREILQQKCEEKGLGNIAFKGEVKKKYIPSILSKSNLNILNYKQARTWKYGGSQNKLFEYLASGRPVCANVKMGYSLIEEYGCGVSENIDNAERYAEIICSYAEMPSDRYDLQCEGALKAASQYDYNILGGKIEEVLKKTVSGGK